MGLRVLVWVALVSLGWCMPARAADEALLTALSGTAIRLAEDGQRLPLVPFSRLSVGDKVELAPDATLTVVIVDAARQEQWQGPGVVELTGQSGSVRQGDARLIAKALPPQIARQIGRTPSSDTVGQFGVVRVRSLTPPQPLGELEQAYAAFRGQVPPGDHSPEQFWLSGLFQLRAMDRLQQEIARLRGNGTVLDPTLAALLDHYAKAF